jgi:excisionase family DNA binding protein
LSKSGKGDTRRLVGVAEAAEYADVSEKTIRVWIRNGRLPGYRMGNRLIKVDLDDIDKFAQPVLTVQL